MRSLVSSFVVVVSLAASLIGVASTATASGSKASPKGKAGPAKPRECVELAKSWDAAIAEAKALNVPILLHAHAWGSAVSWDMHEEVMCNKAYMDFAALNTVEVIVIGGVEDAVAAKDPRAATYEGKDASGAKVRYLVEFPGLTVADLVALKASKADSYNNSGASPFTAVVDPWDQGVGQIWTAAAAVDFIMDAVSKAKAILERHHGKSDTRADLRELTAASADADAKAAKGDFAGAVAAVTKVRGSKSNSSERFKRSADDEIGKIVAAAQKALDSVEAKKKAGDAAGAKSDLAALIPRLVGTGLEEKAKALLDTMK
jgi:hypothetical protein